MTCISADRQRFHVLTETAAVLLVVPFSVWLATRKELPPWARVTAGLFAVGTLAIDGGLLLTQPKSLTP